MATARPRPQVMRLTEAAALRIKDVMARADKPVAGVRVGVKNGGCAGMEYTMEYADAVRPSDEVVEDKGVKILVDPKAVLFLLGTEMDYKTEKLSAQFVFNNPNQTSACGCGELRAIDAVQGRSRRRAVARSEVLRLDPDTIHELFSEFGVVHVRRMFGGAGIYAGDVMFGLVSDGQIYLKADADTVPAFERENCAPFQYDTKTGKRTITSYWRMPDRLYDDAGRTGAMGQGRARRRARAKPARKTPVRKKRL